MLTAFVLPIVSLGSSTKDTASSPWGFYLPPQTGCEVKSCTSGCTVGGVGGHEAPAGGNLNGEGHVGCYAGINCSTMHGTCGGGEVFAPQIGVARSLVLVGLLERAAEGSADAVRAIMEEFPQLASYDRGRGTLQVHGCARDVVIATVPLTPKQRRSISGD